MTETLYFLTAPATDSIENLSVDAERRAKERGCQCARPTFLHYFGPALVTVVVHHNSLWCPRGENQ